MDFENESQKEIEIKKGQIAKVLNETNDLLVKINNDISIDVGNFYESINKILIFILNKLKSDFTKQFLRDLVIGLIVAYITSQIIVNDTVKNIQHIENNYVMSGSPVSEIVLGEKYESNTVKELKNDCIDRSKTLFKIPPKTVMTVLKKNREWLKVSFLINKEYRIGFIRKSDLYYYLP